MTHPADPLPDERPFRIEKDSLGEVRVPVGHLWGAQTQRSIENFPIGVDRFRWGRPVIRALGLVKKCAAAVNRDLERLAAEKADFIIRAAEEVIDGQWDEEFPLVVWQTGSATHTNMNANEVIAHRALQIAREELGKTELKIHPNDDVNQGQSSNDVFPTVMHLATAEQTARHLLLAVENLRETFQKLGDKYSSLVMLGRTHLQDALPLTFGQMISGWVAQLDQAKENIRQQLHGVNELALGGTAVGTGFATHPEFGSRVAALLAAETGLPFQSAGNKFAALAAHDPLLNLSAALRTLASVLMKIANDIRWYASGPRAGLNELLLPENEPGSSIMPGKINPSQCEALTMVAVQVYGNDYAVAFANSQGNFQLNAYKPVILHNVLESIQLLGDGCQSFNDHCAVGIEPNEPKIKEHVESSLMLATALNCIWGTARRRRFRCWRIGKG
ncbi:MAG: class II fumarate hydratase [Planctomycetales bacterium]